MPQALVLTRLPDPRRALHVGLCVYKVQQHLSLSSWAPSSQGPLGCPCQGDSFAGRGIWLVTAAKSCCD